MRFKRSQRIQELLHEEISKLLQRGLKDPRVGFATITDVAKIYVSVMGSEEEKTNSLIGLKSATGFIRSWLGKNLSLRYIPVLEFIRDDTADRVDKISKILHELRTE